jgi:hypothetical protein
LKNIQRRGVITNDVNQLIFNIHHQSFSVLYSCFEYFNGNTLGIASCEDLALLAQNPEVVVYGVIISRGIIAGKR